MTDNDIIKALECCITIEGNSCGGCPVEKGCITDEGVNILHKHALDLINRQKAEIERYKGVIKLLENDVKEAQAELKEFKALYVNKVAEMGIKAFERKIKAHAYYIDTPKEHRVVDEDDIDAVLREMTEGNQ